MKAINHRSRFLARTALGWGAIAVLAMTTLTPLDASAGHKRWARHRDCDPPRRVVVHRATPIIHGPCGVALRPLPIVLHGDRFYWSAAIGLYVPRVWVNVDLGNQPPQGSLFYDPHCDRSFTSLHRYRMHLNRSHHPQVLEVRQVMGGGPYDTCVNESDWYDD